MFPFDTVSPAMPIPVPSLSTGGWVVSPQQKADLLMAHIYESMNNQTYTYPGNITSIQYVIEKHAGDIPGTCEGVQVAMEAYLQRYYDDVSVQVGSDTSDGTGLVTLMVYAQVTEDGVTYPYSGLIQASNSKFIKAVNLNNTGQSVAANVIQQAP
jgi:hypothetical protein